MLSDVRLNETYNHFTLSVIMLSVIMLKINILSVLAPFMLTVTTEVEEVSFC